MQDAASKAQPKDHPEQKPNEVVSKTHAINREKTVCFWGKPRKESAIHECLNLGIPLQDAINDLLA